MWSNTQFILNISPNVARMSPTVVYVCFVLSLQSDWVQPVPLFSNISDRQNLSFSQNHFLGGGECLGIYLGSHGCGAQSCSWQRQIQHKSGAKCSSNDRWWREQGSGRGGPRPAKEAPGQGIAYQADAASGTKNKSYKMKWWLPAPVSPSL